MITADSDIREMLAHARRIAVIGLSPDPDRPSNGAALKMIESGYDIVPVNPHHDTILGLKAYSDLRFVGHSVNMVTVFRDPKHVPEIVEACIVKRVRNLWLQEGVINEIGAKAASDAGIHVVMDRCMAKEYARLLG